MVDRGIQSENISFENKYHTNSYSLLKDKEKFNVSVQTIKNDNEK